MGYVSKIGNVNQSGFAKLGGVTVPAILDSVMSVMLPWGRAVFCGGDDAEQRVSTDIEFVSIRTNGNATDFGDLTTILGMGGAVSNATGDRAVVGGGGDLWEVGGYPPAYSSNFSKVLCYFSIPSKGNAVSFGNLLVYMGRGSDYGQANGTNNRGVFGPGRYGVGDASQIDDATNYITVTTAANAASFGNASHNTELAGATCNGTNNSGWMMGGIGADGTSIVNTMHNRSISTLGNFSDVGNLSVSRYGVSALSSGTSNRGVFGGGRPTGSTYTNVIDYRDLSTTGNASDFGDLDASKTATSATSNGVGNKGVFGGGVSSGPAYLNVMAYITISSLGNASDFGDLTSNKIGVMSCSNGV